MVNYVEMWFKSSNIIKAKNRRIQIQYKHKRYRKLNTSILNEEYKIPTLKLSEIKHSNNFKV